MNNVDKALRPRRMEKMIALQLMEHEASCRSLLPGHKFTHFYDWVLCGVDCTDRAAQTVHWLEPITFHQGQITPNARQQCAQNATMSTDGFRNAAIRDQRRQKCLVREFMNGWQACRQLRSSSTRDKQMRELNR